MIVVKIVRAVKRMHFVYSRVKVPLFYGRKEIYKDYKTLITIISIKYNVIILTNVEIKIQSCKVELFKMLN